MANSTVCQSKWKLIADPHRDKPKTYRQAPVFSSLFPKRGNRNAQRTEKHKNKITQNLKQIAS